ncbi:glutamate synthase 1 [NADH] [Forsythia ovata]|uniref:Glutamate synthase 1 [NADH] n=1 Tax=Forsythia ovata TaxID=205694 RepID=A0ABD1T5A1_9LAMI
MSVASGSGIQVRSNAGGGLVVKPCGSHQLNAVAALSRVGVNKRARVSRGLVKRNVGGLENRFVSGTVVLGGATRLGSERLNLWRTDGPGRAPKLVVKNALSQVPEKPLRQRRNTGGRDPPVAAK